MVVAFKNPLAQLLLVMLLNLVYLLIVIKSEPYIYKKGKYFIKNILVCFNMCMLIVI